MLAIYKRELKSYFTSMMGYVFIGFVLLFIGIYTTAYNLKYLYPAFEIVIDSTAFMFLIVVPILTMRVFAEERKQKTDQLLYSLPLGLGEIVMGKYLAMVTLFAIPTAVICLYPLVLAQFGTVALATAYSSIAAFFLEGCALIALGMFMSSLTENQIISAVLCFAVLLICYLMGGIIELLTTTAIASVIALTLFAVLLGVVVRMLTRSNSMAILGALIAEIPLLVLYLVSPSTLEGAFGTILSALAVFDQMGSFIDGVFDLTSVVYFLSAAALFVFFTVQSLEKRRGS